MIKISKKAALDPETEKLGKQTKKRRDTLKSLAVGSGAVASFQANSNWTKPLLKSTILPAHGSASGTITCTASIRQTDSGEDGGGGEDYNEGLNTFDPSAFDQSDQESNDHELVVNATLSPPLPGYTVALNIDQVSSVDMAAGDSDFDGPFSDSGGGVADFNTDTVTDGGGAASFTHAPEFGFTDMGWDGDSSDGQDGGTITLTVSSEGYSPCEIVINVPATTEG